MKANKTKDKIKKCYLCKEEILDNCVCSWYIVHVFEEGDGYECCNCFVKRMKFDLELERYLTKNLKEMIVRRY